MPPAELLTCRAVPCRPTPISSTFPISAEASAPSIAPVSRSRSTATDKTHTGTGAVEIDTNVATAAPTREMAAKYQP